MFPWDRKLVSYDTLAKLQILASAMELEYTIINSAFVTLSNGTRLMTQEELEQVNMDLLKMEIFREIEVRREKRKLEKLIYGEEQKFCFVTIGFDDNQFDVTNEAVLINPVINRILETPGFDNVKFVVEKFRRNENGEIYIHRHVHLLIDTPLRKAKVIQFIFQKCKKICASPNFVDVKCGGDRVRFEKYIKGDKTDTKLECVAKDKEWREKNKIISM